MHGAAAGYSIIDRWDLPRFLVRVRVGKRKYRTRSFATITEAEEWAASLTSYVAHVAYRCFHPETFARKHPSRYIRQESQEGDMQLPIGAISDALGISRASGSRLIRQGIIAGHRVPGLRSNWRVNVPEAVRFLLSSGIDPAPVLLAAGIDPAAFIPSALPPKLIQ